MWIDFKREMVGFEGRGFFQSLAFQTRRSVQATCTRANRPLRVRIDPKAPGTPSLLWRVLSVGGSIADHRVAIGWRGAGLEGFQDCPLGPGPCPRPALQIHADELDARRNAERRCRLVGKRDFEKLLHDRGCEMTARRAAAKVTRLVVAEIDSNNDVRRKADEPRVLLIVGRAGLSCDGLSNLTHDGRCPP